ncbi:hypothetical protein [Kangiella shandongensis]|uniref:hypothetical protein n=1 Tax=Kangiella shandongensis TaxID=2763258 RepID=UPI001CBECEA5|nr:hypothetical protein [Kangiella shandongensis]
MTRNNYLKIALVISLIALISAISSHGIYTFYLQNGFPKFQSQLELGIIALAILFIVLPALSVIGLLLKKIWGILPLALFPIVATVFSVSTLPFISQVFPVGSVRSIIIIVINILFFLVTVYIGVKSFRQQ